MRCRELGLDHWEQVTGPASIFAAVKMKLARLDHDAAYPIVWGKSTIMEVHYPNSNKIHRFRLTGGFWPKYECERLD